MQVKITHKWRHPSRVVGQFCAAGRGFECGTTAVEAQCEGDRVHLLTAYTQTADTLHGHHDMPEQRAELKTVPKTP